MILSVVEFMCDSLTNICGANQAAKDLCNTARSAASSAPPKTGAQADAFNGIFGIKTVWTCDCLVILRKCNIYRSLGLCQHRPR